MFFVKGWRPLSEVASATRVRYYRNNREFIRYNEDLTPEPQTVATMRVLQRSIISEIWAICASAPRIGMLLTNGRVVDVVSEVVEPLVEDLPFNIYLYLFDGTLGSTYLGNPLGEDVPPSELVITNQYRPFAGLPILLPEVCLAQAREGLKKEVAEEAAAASTMAPAALTRSIVALHDQGAPMTKSTYKEVLAPGASFRAFEAAWRMAAEQRPALAKPGRRPGEIDTP